MESLHQFSAVSNYYDDRRPELAEISVFRAGQRNHYTKGYGDGAFKIGSSARYCDLARTGIAEFEQFRLDWSGGPGVVDSGYQWGSERNCGRLRNSGVHHIAAS